MGGGATRPNKGAAYPLETLLHTLCYLSGEIQILPQIQCVVPGPSL